jgi:tetratricopeptide (TPR) repeat protein
VLADKAVVEGPIDRIGLANNLYAVGEFRLAMEMYEHVEKQELSPEQQIWSEYQAANCLRRLGKNGEASNRYRRLAGMAEAGWLSDQSRWWLEVLEQVRQLEKSLDSDSDSAETPESAIHPTTNAQASAQDAAHEPATPTDDAHNGPLNTTKEHSHGEHSE